MFFFSVSLMPSRSCISHFLHPLLFLSSSILPFLSYPADPEMVQRFGVDYSYDLCPRANIFRRDQGSVVDMESFMAIMRYNNYKADPYSYALLHAPLLPSFLYICPSCLWFQLALFITTFSYLIFLSLSITGKDRPIMPYVAAVTFPWGTSSFAFILCHLLHFLFPLPNYCFHVYSKYIYIYIPR